MKSRSTIKTRGKGNISVVGSNTTVTSSSEGNIISAGIYTVSSIDRIVVVHREDGSKRIVPFARKMKGDAVLLSGDDQLIVDNHYLNEDYEWEYKGKPGFWSRLSDWITGN